MPRIPRLAVGTYQPGVDPEPIAWALMEVLRRSGVQAQSFLSRACFSGHPGASAITGLSVRHLDSWLMSPEGCREVFLRGAKTADLAVVEGRFEPALPPGSSGGRLEPLCQWLDLPQLVILDASQMGGCKFGAPPEDADGLLLDRVANADHLARLRTDLESLWAIPVLGALDSLGPLRAELAAIPCGDRIPREFCQQLGDHFSRYSEPERILDLAHRREMPRVSPHRDNGAIAASKLTVAIAYDEAFNCYFSDTLDLLELRGATVVDFSPLRDEILPPGSDVVYFGCGHPERFAEALAENHCMKAALRSHMCAGKRIYGEGGGAAYLCQQMETPEGEVKRMVGILPAIARIVLNPAPVEAVELSLERPNWLGEKGTRLRGYRNGNWRLEPLGDLVGFAAEPQHRYDLVGNYHAVGSLVHINFALQPSSVQPFFFSEPQGYGVLDPWSAPV
jgi:cobyrinic acid a,c-diamide synthase